MEYGICSANETQELVVYVDRELKNGYQPYGFVFTSMKGELLFYHQAMVKVSSSKKIVIKKKQTLIKKQKAIPGTTKRRRA